jgi:transposase-like protein
MDDWGWEHLSEGAEPMTKDDVLFGYRQQLFAEAARTSVSAACRTFGVHRSTYYHWKRQVDRHGLEMLRPRERRRPQMPNQLPRMVEERILSFLIAHPGLGPKRVSSELRREKWGGIVVSPNGVWKAPLASTGAARCSSLSRLVDPGLLGG